MDEWRGFFLVGAAAASLLFSNGSHAVPAGSKLCDLSILLNSSEGNPQVAECEGFYVRVQEQSVTCGLYDKLSAEMKSAWTTTAAEICKKSESCSHLMAECASWQLSGKDLPKSGSTSSLPGTPSSQVVAAGSPAPATSPSRGASSINTGSAPTTVVIAKAKPATNSAAANSGASATTSAAAIPVSTALPAPRTSIAFASPTSVAPDCYVCIYDVYDKITEAECRARAREARRRGIRKIVVVPELETLSKHKKELCECKNIDALAAVHGQPGEESEPFREIKEILEVAPQCSNLTFENYRCSGVDSATAALAFAWELSSEMAKNGYAGNVTVKGFQTVNNVPTTYANLSSRLDLEAESLPLVVRLIKAPRMLITKSILKKKESATALSQMQRVCDITNTPISFQVCSENVTLALNSCKEPGQVSFLHKAADASQTIVCAKNGKRANQTCTYVPLSGVPVRVPHTGVDLREMLKQMGYGEDGCDSTSKVCLCKWGEAVTCSK